MGADPAKRYSPRLLGLAAGYLRRYFLRNFNALRVAAEASMPAFEAPTILYANHPSWWDPILLLVFAAERLPGRRLFAPIDAAALERYSLLGRFGLFPIRPRTASGAREFLRVSERLLTERANVLALTAQDRFADARERPLALQPGVAHLLFGREARRAIPVAIEYTFWDERLPEALLDFGPPVQFHPGESLQMLAARLERALQGTMDRLAGASLTRNPRDFDTLIESRRRGVGGLYDVFERGRAWLRGRRFDPAHGSIET